MKNKKIGFIIFALVGILFSSFPTRVNAEELGIEHRVKSYLIGSFEDGEILNEYNSDEAMNMASVSKLMTYLVVKDSIEEGKISLEDKVTIDENIEAVEGSSFELKKGEEVSVNDLLKGLMVVSGNDAAYALGVHTATTEEKFADLMNQKAKELGLKNAKFVNASGLQSEKGQNTLTTKEIFELARHIIKKYPEILDYSKIEVLNMPERNYTGYSTIPLVGEVAGVDGLKTGFTEEAGYCLVSTIDARKTPQRGEFRLITVVMGTSSMEERKDITKYLIDYALENYSIRTIIDDKAPYTEIEINSAENKNIEIFPAKSYKTLASKSNKYVLKSNIDKEIKPPLKKGDKVGELSLLKEDKLVTKVDLIVNRDVEKAGTFSRILRAIQKFFTSLGNLLR